MNSSRSSNYFFLTLGPYERDDGDPAENWPAWVSLNSFKFPESTFGRRYVRSLVLFYPSDGGTCTVATSDTFAVFQVCSEPRTSPRRPDAAKALTVAKVVLEHRNCLQKFMYNLILIVVLFTMMLIIGMKDGLAVDHDPRDVAQQNVGTASDVVEHKDILLPLLLASPSRCCSTLSAFRHSICS